MRFHLYVFGFLLIALLAVPVYAAVGEQLPMDVYRSPDGAYSFFYPRGWMVKQEGNGFSIIEDPGDPASMGIDVMVGYSTKPEVHSVQVIARMEKGLRKLYGDVKLMEVRQVSQNPDISGTIFSFKDKNRTIGGFGISMCRGNNIFWADIYGTRENIARYNYVHLLIFVLQSMNTGPMPNQPQGTIYTAMISPQPQVLRGHGALRGGAKADLMKRAVRTRFWKTAPKIKPQIFKKLMPAFEKEAPSMAPGEKEK